MQQHRNQLCIRNQNIHRFAAALLAFVMVLLSIVSPAAAIKQDGLVRIYLSSMGSVSSLSLTLKAAYHVNGNELTLVSGTQAVVTCDRATGQLSLSAGGQSWRMGEYFTLNRSSMDASATISQSGHNNPYPADFSFTATQKNGSYVIQTVAHIQVEDYLYGVLRYEMDNSFPLEALKAQAVAARTYTLRMMDKRSGNAYDMVDTVTDQLYKGTPSSNANCQKAVDETAGMVLRYGNGYAETYYSSSNGGQTESAENIWGGKGYGYLTVKDDPYDAASASAKTKTFTIKRDLQTGQNQSLLALLKKKAVECLKQNGYAATTSNTTLLTLDSVKLHKPKYASPSKLYTKAEFILTVQTKTSSGNTTTATVAVTADIFSELEGLLGMSLQSSKNELWSVSSNADAFVLKAGRFGHGVGLSQYGAMEMARQGHTYKSILDFYYPGCSLTKLDLSDAPTGETGGTMLPEAGSDRPSGEASQRPNENVAYATVIANGFVNLRQSPSLQGQIVGTAPTGENVRILRDEGAWAYVEYNNIEAYAMRSLLSETFFTDNAILVPSQQPQTTPAPTVSAANQAMIFSTNGTVNFRRSPYMGNNVMMQLPHGTMLEYFETVGEFTKVTYLGIDGYVMTSFLVFGDAVAPQVPVAPPEPTINQETMPTPEAVVPTVTQPPVTDVGYQLAIVSTLQGSLNLRQEPYAYARIQTRIPQYAQIEAKPINSKWCQVRYMGLEGYVMAEFLTFQSTAVPQTTPEPTYAVTPDPTYAPDPLPSLNGQSIGKATVTTNSGSLNMRFSPSSSAAVIRTIPRGATVDVYQMNGQWALVQYQYEAGYVMTAYLTLHGIGTPSVTDALNNAATPAPVRPDLNGFSGYAQRNAQDYPEGYETVDDLVAVAGFNGAQLRVAPSYSERALFTIPVGETATVLAVTDSWCIARWQEYIGYICLTEAELYPAEAFR